LTAGVLELATKIHPFLPNKKKEKKLSPPMSALVNFVEVGYTMFPISTCFIFVINV
jgi:hypothetical protein